MCLTGIAQSSESGIRDQEFRNERIYAVIAGSVFAVAIAYNLVPSNGASPPAFWISLVLMLGVVAMEIVLYRRAGRALGGEVGLPLWMRGSELTLVVAAVFAEMWIDGYYLPDQGLPLHSPAPYAFITIAVSLAVRLDVVLCVYAVILLPTAYLLLSVALLGASDYRVLYLLFAPGEPVGRAALIGGACVMSALISYQLRTLLLDRPSV